MSTSSFTGVSSGRVTSSTRQRAGSVSILEHVLGLGPHRADPHGVEQRARWPEEGDGVTGGRGVEHDEVGRPARSRDFTLPSMRMSLMPGAAVATTSRKPELVRRFESRRMPWSSRYSSRAWSDVIVRARTPSATSISS